MCQEGPYTLVVRPGARRDVRRNQRYLERENPHIAQVFLDDIGRALAIIAAAPRCWAEWIRGIHRYPLLRFHVTIYYRIADAEVHILPALDQRRHPDTWRCPP